MKRFKFTDEAMCPHCNKPLDNCPARDFIVFDMNGKPNLSPVEEFCGWCDKRYSAQVTGENEITFKLI